MALSNWATLAIDEGGASHNGVLEFDGTVVSFYKNWLYLSDAAAWRDKGGYVEHTIMQVQHGELQYRSINIIAERGPQEGIYAAVWAPVYEPTTIMVGCGVYGYDDDGEYTGVNSEAASHFREFLTRRDTEEKCRAIAKQWEVSLASVPPELLLPKEVAELAKRIPVAIQGNQGDAFFADALGDESLRGGSPVGESTPPILENLGKPKQD